MPECDSNSNHPNILNNHHQPSSSSSSSSGSGSQLKKSSLPSTTTTVGLVPSSNEEQRGLLTVTVSPSSGSKSFSSSAGSSQVSGSCSGGVVGVKVVGRESESVEGGPLLYPDIRACASGAEEDTDTSPQKKSGCFNKMFTCRVLVLLLLVKCLVLSFIIPAHLSPTTSSEYPAPDYVDNAISGNGGGGGDGDSSHQSTGDEDGFDNNIMLDDQPLSLTLKTEIMNLVEPFDILSQPVTVPEPNGVEESNGAHGADGNGDSTDGNSGGNDDGGDDDDNMAATTPETTDTTDGESGGDGASESDAGGDADNDGESQSGGDGANTDSDSGPASSESSTSESSNGGSCSAPSGGNSDSSMTAVMEKIESLMEAVKNIDTSIDKMETLVQSTMIDERVYKCMSAINNGNQTQALKYWKQILRYLSTPQKQAAVLNQLIRESYGGTEDHILPVIQFIEQTNQYYGYYTLFKELSKYDHLYKNTAIFTLGHHVKKSCGRDSALYKSLPGAVQSVFADFFTLQNKHNKGYLYYAKRCVSKHYHHCLDVLTKRIDPYVLDGLGNDSEEKKRYHWRLNATDTTVTKFFILNHDQYWVYRLQDLNNSPRFKMEEAGSNAEVEQAHFQLQLNTDDEIMIRVRDTEDYLEEEDFKSDKAEVRLHSFHQADGIPDSPRMFWLVNPVSTSSESMEEPDSCNVELASVTSTNGNGNGSSK